MNIKTGNQIMDSGFTYLENRIASSKENIELPSFLKGLRNIIGGFYPGRLTVVNDFGTGSNTFIFSLLYEFVVQNDISTYFITQKYNECYISMNLLKYEYPKYGYRHMLSGFFNEKNLEELKSKYQATKNKRMEKGFGKEFPLYFSRFHEYDIKEIQQNVYSFIQKLNSKDNINKKLLILTDIKFDDLKIIKEMAEIYFLPVIVIFSNEHRSSSYVDSEINLTVSPLYKNEEESEIYKIPYEVSVKNNIILVEGETVIEMDLVAGLFI